MLISGFPRLRFRLTTPVDVMSVVGVVTAGAASVANQVAGKSRLDLALRAEH